MRAPALTVLLVFGLSHAASSQQVTIDLGFVNASGNANFTSLNLGEKLTHKFGQIALTQDGKILYGRTEGTTTTESYDIGARAQDDVTKRVGIYALLRFQRDPFAGVASRWFGGPGVALGLVQTAHDTLAVESGITEQRERSTADVTQSFGAARTAASYKHLFAAKSSLTETLEWIASLKSTPAGKDQRLNSETALTAPLSRQIGLRLSYLIRFRNLPEPGFKKTDRILTTGVQIAF